MMISLVLATDMSKHFSELGKLKARLASADFDPKTVDKDITRTTMFHLADISNGTKPWEICQKWTDLLFNEFFKQGDLERKKGMNISYLMDRTTVNIAKSQIGFLDVIITPAFTAASQILELTFNIANVEINKGKWSSLFEEYEDRMIKERPRHQDVTFNV